MADWLPPADPDFDELEDACRTDWLRDNPKLIAFDTETTGLTYADTAFCVTFAWPSRSGNVSHYVELDTPQRRLLARTILSEASRWVGHNIKFDLNKVIDAELTTRERIPIIHDTEALAHLDNEHRPKGLKDLAIELLGIDVETVEVEYKSGPKKGEKRLVPKEKWEIEQARLWAKKKYQLASVKDVGYHLLPRGTVVPYAKKDALWTLGAMQVLAPQITRYEDLLSLYKQEMELTLVLLDMERQGMAVDEPYVDEKVREYAKKVLEHYWGVEGIVGKPVRVGKIPPKERAMYFNPSSSSPDVGAFLTEAGFPSESYDEAHLLQINHPLSAAILSMREDEKILNSYFRAMQAEAVDGVLHPHVRQHGTRTGRVSAGKETG